MCFQLILHFCGFLYFRQRLINLCVSSLWNWVIVCKCKVKAIGGQLKQMLVNSSMIIFFFVIYYDIYLFIDCISIMIIYPYYLRLRQQSAKLIGGKLKLLVGNINKSFKSSLQPSKRVFLHFVGTNGNLNPRTNLCICGSSLC